MIVLTHLFATAVALAAGFGWLSLLRWPGVSSRTLIEQLGLCYLVGILWIAAQIYVYGVVGIPATLFTVLAGLALPLAALALRIALRGKAPLFRLNVSLGVFARLRWWEWVLIALIVSKLVYVGVMNAHEIRRTDDAFTWALSLAKTTYYEQTHANFEMQRNYPKVPGLTIAWFGMASGDYDEFAINLTYLNFYWALLLLFYANLRARIDRGGALVGVYLLSALPILLNHAVLIGYADILMATFLCFAGTYAYRHACEGRLDDLILAAVFALGLPLIKLEGRFPYFLLALYGLLVAVAYRRRWLSPLGLWGVTGALVVLGFAALGVLAAAYGEAGPPFLHDRVWYRIRPGMHWAEIKTPLAMHFGWFYNNWLVVGPLCALALAPLTAAFWKRPEMVIGLYALLLLVSYVYLFCVGGAYEFLVNGTTVNRSFLQIVPAMLFAVTVMLWRLSVFGVRERVRRF